MRQTILRPLPSAVYRCIIPIEEPFTTPSAVYYSPFGQSREVHQVPYYRAWPDIDHPKRLACLPGLLRAMYMFDLNIHVAAEDVARRAGEYLSHPEGIAPEIRQQVQAILKTQQSLTNHAHEITDLSPSGTYTKKPKQAFADTHNACIDLVRALSGGQTRDNPDQLALAALRGLLHNHFNFPGMSYFFSLVHEMGHMSAKWTYSGVVQEGLVEHLHTTLYTLATKKGLSQQKITQLWEEFAQTNEQFVSLARKFELIEEIYATYLAMAVLPPEVSTKVREAITVSLEAENWIKVEKWDKAYEAFGEACASYQNSLARTLERATVFVFNAVCRILRQIDNIDGAEVLCAFAKIRKAVWPYIKAIKQEHGSDLDEFNLEDMAQKEAAVKINRILKRARISQELYWSSIDSQSSIYKRGYELFNNGFTSSDRGLAMLLPPAIRLVGKLSSHEITPFILSLGFHKEDKHKLSPSIRIFCESLRQQLSKPCGIVCPLAYEGKVCCGKKELLQKLYERLPEKVKSNYEAPNCDDIR